MTLDKFGSHIMNKYDKTGSDSISQNNSIKFINITNDNLYYALVLPFIGKYDSKEANFLLAGEKNRTSYRFPFEKGTILTGEYPKKDINLLVNGKGGKLEGRPLIKGDLIAFRRDVKSTISEFYGELIIKCPVIIEN